MLRGRHEEDDGIRVRDKLRRQAAHERDLLETDRENQQMRAEISVIESQMAVMRGALTAPTRAHSNTNTENSFKLYFRLQLPSEMKFSPCAID